MMWLFQDLVAIQRDIYFAFADRIREFAETGDWALLVAYLPMGILFGAVHALTPGHSKAVLATYLTGSTLPFRSSPWRWAALVAPRCWKISAAGCSA